MPSKLLFILGPIIIEKQLPDEIINYNLNYVRLCKFLTKLFFVLNIFFYFFFVVQTKGRPNTQKFSRVDLKVTPHFVE